MEYGNFRERLNNYLRLGSDEVKYGLVKWFDTNKGFGVIIDSSNAEYFWRDSSYMSWEVNTGDPIIFTTEYNHGKYRIKKCRFPQLLEDWNFFKNLSDSEVQFIIKTYCKVDPYSIGSRSMGNRDIKYNLKTNACDKILRKQNAHLFKDVELLSDLILYAASHHSWLHITINSFKHLYTEEGFRNLSYSLFDIIKNYKELWRRLKKSQ